MQEYQTKDESIVVENVTWEALVNKYQYDVDLFCVKTELTFQDNEETNIGKANITVLDQDTEPYDLLEAADIISGDLVYSFNGVPVYEDEFDLIEKLNKGKIGVYGKVAIVENFYLNGPIDNIKDAEEMAMKSLIDYFSNVQIVDFIILNPILCDFHEHTLHEAENEHQKRLIGVQKIRATLKEELNFFGSQEPTDSLIYPLVGLDFNVNTLSEQEKFEHIHKMTMYLENNKPELAFESAQEGHKLGVPECTFQLGVFYITGEVVEEDQEMAFQYFFELAQDGQPDAMYNVAMMYFDGIGVHKDASLGYMWMEKAAGKNQDKALDFLDRFRNAQIEMAKNGGIFNLFNIDKD